MKIIVMEGCYGNTIEINGSHQGLLTVEELRATMHLLVDTITEKEDLIRLVDHTCLNHIQAEDVENHDNCAQCGSSQVTFTYEV